MMFGRIIENKSTSQLSVCLQEKEMEKQKTLYQQARLHERGAAEMVLQMISASKGNNTSSCLDLQGRPVDF